MLYADDIVLVSDNRDELQKMMDTATKWGKKWKCTFNKKKSEVVVFGLKKEEDEEWRLGGGK